MILLPEVLKMVRNALYELSPEGRRNHPLRDPALAALNVLAKRVQELERERTLDLARLSEEQLARALAAEAHIAELKAALREIEHYDNGFATKIARAALEPRVECDGSSGCKATTHIYGCARWAEA